MKKNIKISIMIVLMAVVITIMKISKNYTWENDFNTKLFCEIIEIVFIILPLLKYYSDLLGINTKENN